MMKTFWSRCSTRIVVNLKMLNHWCAHLNRLGAVAASPKSATTAVYFLPCFLKRQFLELRSRWSILFLWRYSMPWAISMASCSRKDQERSIDLSWISCSSAPPLTYCVCVCECVCMWVCVYVCVSVSYVCMWEREKEWECVWARESVCVRANRHNIGFTRTYRQGTYFCQRV